MSEIILTPDAGELGKSGIDRLAGELKAALRHRRFAVGGDGEVRFLGNLALAAKGVYDVKILRHKRVIRALETGDFGAVKRAREWVRRNRPRLSPGGFDVIDACVAPNLIPTAALTHLLAVYWGGSAAIATWYIAPFSSDSTPGVGWESNWAGAGSGPLATEFTDYDEVNRQAATFGTAASASIATPSATVFTISTGQSNVTIYGATLNSIQTQAYNATDQVLASAFRFATAKSGLGASDEIEIKYTVTATSS